MFWYRAGLCFGLCYLKTFCHKALHSLITKVDPFLPKDINTISHISNNKLNFFLLLVCVTTAWNIALVNRHKWLEKAHGRDSNLMKK